MRVILGTLAIVCITGCVAPDASAETGFRALIAQSVNDDVSDFAPPDDSSGSSAPSSKVPTTTTYDDPGPLTGDSGSSGTAIADASGADADSYPRVTALENAILGKSFVNEDLGARLARMEAKAFGTASTNPDLGARTDALQNYAEQKLHKKLFKVDNTEMDTSADDDGGQSVDMTTDYPHVDALEKAILGQAYRDDSLEDRLARMEAKAFGHASTKIDLSERTDALEKFAEKNLGMKPFDNTAEVTNGQAPKAKGGFLNSLEKTVLGMAGYQSGPNGPSFITPGMAPYGLGGLGMGNNLSTMGVGALGAGPGMGTGFSGIRVRNKADLPVDQQIAMQEKDQPRVEDPAVNAPNPPPSSARLIVKVGWCEVQMFSHTFPDMHLTERLQQLNNEVSFDPGKKGTELMDHIDALMSAVEKKAHPKVASPPTVSK